MRELIFTIGGLAGVMLMYLTQVPPKQAVSNIAEWAVALGWTNPPVWLKSKETDRVIRHAAGVLLLAWLIAAIFSYTDPTFMKLGPQILLALGVLSIGGALVWNFLSPPSAPETRLGSSVASQPTSQPTAPVSVPDVVLLPGEGRLLLVQQRGGTNSVVGKLFWR